MRDERVGTDNGYVAHRVRGTGRIELKISGNQVVWTDSDPSQARPRPTNRLPTAYVDAPKDGKPWRG